VDHLNPSDSVYPLKEAWNEGWNVGFRCGAAAMLFLGSAAALLWVVLR
jgi:hypothetical protein